MFKHVFLQIETMPTDTIIESTNIVGLVSELGILGIIILALLFILSCITVYVTIERYSAIKRADNHDSNFMNMIKDFVSSGNIAAAKDLCARTDSPDARMIEKGVNRIGKSLRDIDAAIENQGNLEIYKLEKRMNLLATISGAAPMLGFLGTVTGMIKTFHDLSTGNIGADELSGGIYEAMFTTAAGLAVGILAFVAYNLLTSMIGKVIFQMEANNVAFIDLLQEPSK